MARSTDENVIKWRHHLMFLGGFIVMIAAGLVSAAEPGNRSVQTLCWLVVLLCMFFAFALRWHLHRRRQAAEMQERMNQLPPERPPGPFQRPRGIPTRPPMCKSGRCGQRRSRKPKEGGDSPGRDL